MRRALSLLALLAAGCDSGALELQVNLPSAYQDQVELHVSVYTPREASAFDCEAIGYGDVSAETLRAAQVLSAPLEEAQGELSDVPRRGTKIVVVQGYDALGREALRGCGSVGELQQRVTVEVSLTPTVVLHTSITEQLYATVGQAQASPPIVAEAYTVDGAAIDAQLRLRVFGGGGKLASSSEVAGGDARLRGVAVPVSGPGPLAAELRARNGVEPLPALASGFAEPAGTLLNPFADAATSGAVHVVPLGEDRLAFVTVVPEVLSDSSRVLFAVPRLGPPLEFTVTEPALPGTLASDYLGPAFDPVSGQAGAALWQNPEVGDGSDLHHLLLVSPEATLVVIDYTPSLRWSGRYTALAMLPLGPCSQHAYAPPFLIGIRRQLGITTKGLLVHVDPPRVEEVDFDLLPISSVCVSETGGAAGVDPPLRRLLVLDDVQASQSGRRVADLGAGLDAGAAWDDVTGAPSQFLPAAINVLRLQVPGGLAEPLVLFNRDVDVALYRAQLAPAGRPELLAIEELLFTLPSIPNALVVGSVVSPQVEIAALIFSPEPYVSQLDEGQPAPGQLLMSSGGQQVGPLVTGAMRLPECFAAASCELRALDLDGDGLLEIATARSSSILIERMGSDRARIIDLSP